MNKKLKVALGFVVVMAFVQMRAVVTPVETKEEFLKGIPAAVNEILDDALNNNNYEFLLTEAIPDIETEEELNIVESVLNGRAGDIGKFNKNKIDKVIATTRAEIRKLAQLSNEERKTENLGQALRSLSKSKI